MPKKKKTRWRLVPLQKQKTQKKQRAKMVMAAIVLLVLFVFCIPFVRNALQSYEARTRTVMDSYLAERRSPDVWWLMRTPTPSAELADILAQRVHVITNVVQKVRDASPLAGQIADAFKDFNITVFRDGVSFATVRGDATLKLGLLEVSFISLEEVQKLGDRWTPVLPSAVFWKEEWNAMMLFGIEWPTNLFAGVLLHELGHGYYDMVRKMPSSIAGPASEEYAQEEIMMHELQLAVLNVCTDGQYGREAEEIIRLRKKKGGTVEHTLARVTLPDLARLDRALGLERSGEITSSVSVALHYIVLGLRAIDGLTLSPEEKLREKISCYRWLRRIGETPSLSRR